MKARLLLLAIGAFVGAALRPAPAAAQIGGMIRGAVNNAAQTKINNMVNCAVNDQDCIDKAHAAGKQVQVVDKDGKPLKDQSAANKTSTDSSASGGAAGTAGAGSNDPPGKGAWLNYDFIPGERVIFYDDFSSDHVGDLPTHEDISSGNVTVVSIKGQNYLRTANSGEMTIMLPEVLPTRFTIEFLFHRKGGNGSGIWFHMGPEGKDLRLRCDQGNGSIYGTGPNGQKQSGEEAPGVGENDIETCRVMVDGGYAKAYVNATRVGQLNGLVFDRTNKIQVDLANANDDGMLLTNIRVAAGGKTDVRRAQHGWPGRDTRDLLRHQFRQDSRRIDTHAATDRRHAHAACRSQDHDRGAHRQYRHGRG